MSFYRPAMAPSFVDSRRSTKLGFNLASSGNVLENPPLISPRTSENPPLDPITNLSLKNLAINIDPRKKMPNIDPPASPDHSRLPNPVDIRWRGINLPVYDGAWDADVISEWIFKMDSFFDLCAGSMSEEEKISCAAFHLTATAHKWWRNLQSEAAKNRSPQQQQQQENQMIEKEQRKIKNRPKVKSWKDFKARITSFFMPMEAECVNGDPRRECEEDRLKLQVCGLKQEWGVSLRDYGRFCIEFWLDASGSLSQGRVARAYVEGLCNTSLRHLVRHAGRIGSLQQAMRLATMYDRDRPGVCPWCHEKLIF